MSTCIPLCGAVLADHAIGVLDAKPLWVVRVTNESKHLHRDHTHTPTKEPLTNTLKIHFILWLKNNFQNSGRCVALTSQRGLMVTTM